MHACILTPNLATCPPYHTRVTPLHLHKTTPTPNFKNHQTKSNKMADQHHHRQQFQQFGHQIAEKSPNTSQILAIVTLFPLGAFLLLLAGLTLAATVIGLAITTPLFILFSPVLVPSALTISLAVAGFLTSGVFGVTGLSSVSWIVNYIRRMRGSVPEQMDYMKRRAADAVGYLGQNTEDVGQDMQSRAHATTRGGGVRASS